MDINLEKYSRVVWKMGGRELPYLDCYGFALDVRRALGLGVWPEYPEHNQDNLHGDILFHSGEPLSEPTEGSIIICYRGELAVHMAICLKLGGELMAVECQKKVNVRILELGQLERRYTKLEFFS